MEFSFDVTKVLPASDDGIAILNAKNFYSKPSIYPSYSTQKQSNSPTEPQLIQIVDKIGTASSKAQGLKAVITDYSKFVTSDHRLYLKIDSNAVLGLLKVGEKNLFHHDALGNVKELRPLCVLDFYIHESVQRIGVGKELFERMLKVENSEAYLIAYDRPSTKLLGFHKKHYGLANFIPQNNNFVIFNEYFEKKGDGNQLYDPKSGRLKKPVSLSNHSNTQSEFYKEGVQGDRYTNEKLKDLRFADDIEQDPQFQQIKQVYPVNKQRQQQQSSDPIYHGYNSSWVDPSTQKSAKMLNQNSEAETKRLTRGERNLIDIQDKLKRTEEDIEKCQQKIEELSKQKTGQTGEVETKPETKGQEEDASGRGKFKQRIQELNNRSTPWATHHNIVTQPSSSVYGSYLTKKY